MIPREVFSALVMMGIAVMAMYAAISMNAMLLTVPLWTSLTLPAGILLNALTQLALLHVLASQTTLEIFSAQVRAHAPLSSFIFVSLCGLYPGVWDKYPVLPSYQVFVCIEHVTELGFNRLHYDPTPTRHNDSQLRGTQGIRYYINVEQEG